MVIYENASIYIEKKGFAKDPYGKMGQYEFDTDNEKHMKNLQDLANLYQTPVYLIREFVAIDADYQDHHPKKSSRDWHLLKIEPHKVE